MLFFNRFNFSLSYSPGSKNVKSDAHHCQFQSEKFPTQSEKILPSTCINAAVSWAIEDNVKQSHTEYPAPSACPTNCLFVQANLRYQVLQLGHSSHLAYHPGVACSLLQTCFWWASMGRDTGCQICSQHKKSALLQPLPFPRWSWSHITMDLSLDCPILMVTLSFSQLLTNFPSLLTALSCPNAPLIKRLLNLC